MIRINQVPPVGPGPNLIRGREDLSFELDANISGSAGMFRVAIKSNGKHLTANGERNLMGWWMNTGKWMNSASQFCRLTCTECKIPHTSDGDVSWSAFVSLFSHPTTIRRSDDPTISQTRVTLRLFDGRVQTPHGPSPFRYPTDTHK